MNSLKTILFTRKSVTIYNKLICLSTTQGKHNKGNWMTTKNKKIEKMQQDWELDDHKKLKKCSKTVPTGYM